MSGVNPGDLVLALDGRVDWEQVGRMLADPQLRRTLTAAWSTRPPSVAVLARAMRLAALGQPSLLELLDQLHLKVRGRASNRSAAVVGALYSWSGQHGNLRWFTESTLVSSGWRAVLPYDCANTDGFHLSMAGTAPGTHVRVTVPTHLLGHELALMVVDAAGAVELAGPGHAVIGELGADVLLELSAGFQPVKGELLSRRQPIAT